MHNWTQRTSLILLSAVLAAPVLAQSTLDWPVGELQPYHLDSGSLANPERGFPVVYAATVKVEDAAWLRLYFSKAELGPGSFVRMTSAFDNEVQELDADGLAMWSYSSAYFNGDTVYLELVAGPETTNNHVVLEQVAVDIVEGGLRGPCADDDCGICGSDNRVLSSELWTGRLMPVGCTASIYNTDSCAVCAGHCADTGYSLTLQFNVPSSSSSCYPNNPPVADQFPITARLYNNGGVGNDWSVLTVGTNSQGQTPYQRYGVYRPISSTLGSAGDSAPVWGYGVDNNNTTRSQVQQTHAGTIGARYTSRYTFSTDVTYGNSGSALMLNDEIIGIVTHCSFDCTNVATRIDLAAFQNARQQLCGGGGSGYCDAWSNSTSYEYISRVAVGSINNSSSSSGYADYTSLSTNMQIGVGYPITVTIGNPYSSDIGGLWADWNQDEDFSDAGETITTAWSGSGPYTTTITPPASALAGSTRLRVRIQDGTYDPTVSSCGETDYGEVEDYTVNVISECNVTFTSQPAPLQVVCAGGLFSLHVTVENPYLMTYQWRRGTTPLVNDGVRIFGATTDTLFVLNVNAGDAGNNYNCRVTNTAQQCSVASDYAEIVVDTDLPVITQQPQDRTVTEGGLASFSVTVQNGYFMDYQWRKDGGELSDGGRFYGCTTDTLMISPVQEADEGDYDCVVTSQLGGQCSTTSNSATLTVNPAGNDCPEDLNGDGHIGLEDLATLLAHYGQSGVGPEDGDLDGDGTVSLSDLAQLLAVYGQDCPTH